MRDERGVALAWAVVTMPVMLLLAVLVADLVQWQVLAQQLQTAVDAAALAGAQEVWVRQEIDATGVVWSQEVFLNEEEARRQALEVLDANLERIGSSRFSPGEREVEVNHEARTVRVTVRVAVPSLLAHRFGLRPPKLSRTGSAEPAIP